MGMGRTEHHKDAGIGGNEILHKYLFTSDKLRAVYLLRRFSHDPKLRTEGGGCLCLITAMGDHLPGQLHCKVIMLISCVTDENSGHRIPDLFPGWIR